MKKSSNLEDQAAELIKISTGWQVKITGKPVKMFNESDGSPAEDHQSEIILFETGVSPTDERTAKLLTEAHNLKIETGFSPMELQAQIKEMFDFLEEMGIAKPSTEWTEKFRDKWNRIMHNAERAMKIPK